MGGTGAFFSFVQEIKRNRQLMAARTSMRMIFIYIIVPYNTIESNDARLVPVKIVRSAVRQD
jgi:hypothetical protein